MNITTESQFRHACLDAVHRYYFKELRKGLRLEDIYVVWQVKALQNFKALLSTNVPDTRYFEITYNGDKQEMYFDAYTKEKNVCIKELIPWTVES
jgi:hypothetical protein